MKSSVIFGSSFNRSLILSFFLHIIIFAVIGLSNYLISPAQKNFVHYVNLNFVGSPGGGAGGGGSGPEAEAPGSGKAGEPVTAKKESMKELTVAKKVPAPSSSLRHPVEKTNKTGEKVSPKKTVISAPQLEGQKAGSTTSQGAGGGSGGGGGSGLRIGVGEGPGGFGSGYGDALGASSFPYSYYLQIIVDRVSSNWFSTINNLELSGEYQSVVYFRIQKNGQVTDLKIEQSSGLPALDLSARRAVELASPFPPLPRDFENDYLVIHLIFERSK